MSTWSPSTTSVVHRAANVILRNADEVLLLRRSGQSVFWPGYWCLPGGSCESGESFMDAAIRELREETGITDVPMRSFAHQHLTVQNSPEISSRQRPPPLQRSRVGDPVELAFFLGETDERLPVTLDPDEHEEHAWLSLADLSWYRTMPWDLEPLRRAFSIPRDPGARM